MVTIYTLPLKKYIYLYIYIYIYMVNLFFPSFFPLHVNNFNNNSSAVVWCMQSYHPSLTSRLQTPVWHLTSHLVDKWACVSELIKHTLTCICPHPPDCKCQCLSGSSDLHSSYPGIWILQVLGVVIKLKADGCQDASVAHRECWLLIRRREGEGAGREVDEERISSLW